MTDEQYLTDENDSKDGSPKLIAEQNLTEIQQQIKQAILKADDSYQVKLLTPIKNIIKIEINAQIPAIYAPFAVKTQVIAKLCCAQSFNAKRANFKLKTAEIYQLLSSITALNNIEADFNIQVINQPLPNPCYMQYVTENSILVNVTHFVSQI